MSWRAIFNSLRRESRAARGRLLFFTLCLAIGVAAVVGISALVGAMEAGMRDQSRDLLAADLRVSARRPLPSETLSTFFAQHAHQRAEVLQLSAMASLPIVAGAEGASRLVELKVIDGGYPFYGTLQLAPQLPVSDLGDQGIFAGPELLSGLGVQVGDGIRLGGQDYRILAEILDEPDRLDFSLTLGPRVFMSKAGLERTELLTAHSRVRYTDLYRLALDPTRPELEEIHADLLAALEPYSYVRARTHFDAQPNVRRSLGRVEDYLGLVALLSLLLGGIGVSQIVRAWIAGRARSVAVMRCIGFRAREIAVMYLGHVALLALAGCLLGGALGAALPWAVSGFAPELFQGGAVQWWQPAAIVRGMALGLLVAPVFSLPPLTAVWQVPPAAVLRSDVVPLRPPALVRWGSLVVLFLGVLVSARVQGGNWLVAGSFSGGLLVLAGLLYGGARLATGLSARLPRGRFGPYLEHGLAALARPGSGTIGAIVALGLGVLVLVSMLLIEGQLHETMTNALPRNAPSIFLVDVQPDQWEGVSARIAEQGAESVDSVPVVMARLRSLDGKTVDQLVRESKEGERSAWTYTREQRLTWMESLPEGNEITAGELWSDPQRAEVSLEEGYAESMGAVLGTVMIFDVQGIAIEFVVTSLRSVEWESFKINFFLVVEPGVLEEAPHSRIATARLEPPAAEYALQNILAAEFPNVTMLRIRPILEKVAGVLARIAMGVRWLGGFTILTGLVILGGAVGTSALRRAREAAILKTLGVTRAGVTLLFAVEYALSGLVAGAIGAAGGLVLSWAFLVYLADLEAELSLLTIPAAALLAAVLATASGLAASIGALRARPLETLR